MTKDIKVRMNWLKGMYIYTIVAAGGFGLGIILMPEVMKSMLGWPGAEPIAWGIVGTIYIAFRILSIFGLCSPLKFVPILFLQLCYKSIWLIGVVLPLLMTKQFLNYALSFYKRTIVPIQVLVKCCLCNLSPSCPYYSP